jgi:hypothetical protein
VDRILPVLVIVAVLTLVFSGMYVGWRGRRRRQATLGELAAAPADLGEIHFVDDLLYVATTCADAPLERVAISGLGFRAGATATVAAAGVRLDVAGRRDPVFLPVADLRGAGRATWTIDRVVRRDGLVFVRWNLGGTEVDTNLRSSQPDALLTALTRIAPAASDASHSPKEVA